jgi:glycosyltransferase involved in cell wall biosynthesis
MKILYHHRTLGDGAEGIHIREMVRAFRDLGHEVRVIGPAGEIAPGTSSKPARLAAIKRAIPVVIFEMLEIGYTAYAFLKTAWVVRSFKPDFIYERYITFNAGPVLAARACGVPLCLEVNAPLALERSQEKDERLTFRGIAKSMERWICAHSTRTIVVSTPLREYLESIGVPRGHSIVMANGVDPERFSPREKDVALRTELGIPPDSFVIGFTGVLRPWHGLDMLVDALADLVARGLNVYLLIIGGGPYQVELDAQVKKLNLSRFVKITGRVPHDRVPGYVSLLDVAVSPRATFYASPMKVIEYMALGKPVVVPGTANFLDIVDAGVNGVTFADGNVKDLAEALARLAQDPAACRELGVRAREKVEKRLNWRWNARTTCELMKPPA